MKRNNMPEELQGIEVESNYIPEDGTVKIPSFLKKWTEHHWESLERLCLIGGTVEEILKFFRIGSKAFYEAMSSSKRFRDIIDNGRAERVNDLIGAAFKSALGCKVKDTFFHGYKGRIHKQEYEKDLPPNEKMIQFLLQNYKPEVFGKSNEINATVKMEQDIIKQDKILDGLDTEVLEKMIEIKEK